MKWKSDVDELMKTFKFAKTEEIEEPISAWLYTVRTLDKDLIQSPGLFLWHIILVESVCAKVFLDKLTYFLDSCHHENEVN